MAEHTVPIASAPTGWRKSTYSGSEGGSCVEVPALLFPTAGRSSFVTALKDGQLS